MQVLWSKGGEADVAGLDGERIALSSTIPSAPGSRLEGALATGERLIVKVHRCKRQEAGFRIEGRVIDATRALRATLEKLAQPTPESRATAR